MHTTEEDGRHMLIEDARRGAQQASDAAQRNAESLEALSGRIARIERMLGLVPLQVTPADVLAIIAHGRDREPTRDELLGAEWTAQIINAVNARVLSNGRQ
ncbi:MAG: hypothetical protein PGN30_10280 [Mycolicibacterium neoaurum]|uniref:hypothetical protein n=1 Tax=Mycolicibacterium neoaurum TaxID=1795 RepID=UPI002FF7A04F